MTTTDIRTGTAYAAARSSDPTGARTAEAELHYKRQSIYRFPRALRGQGAAALEAERAKARSARGMIRAGYAARYDCRG